MKEEEEKKGGGAGFRIFSNDINNYFNQLLSFDFVYLSFWWNRQGIYYQKKKICTLH